jgi:hypothetical protein
MHPEGRSCGVSWKGFNGDSRASWETAESNCRFLAPRSPSASLRVRVGRNDIDFAGSELGSCFPILDRAKLVTDRPLCRHEMDGGGGALRPELLLKKLQVGGMFRGNENSLGYDRGGSPIEGLKSQGQVGRRVVGNRGLQQISPRKIPRHVGAVAKQSFVTEPCLGRGGQEASIASIEVRALEPVRYERQQNHEACEPADDYHFLLEASV